VINDENEFFELLSNRDKYMLCTDSKTTAEIAHLKLKTNHDDVVIFTSDSETKTINLDDHDKIIYSPKIIYGLDSTIKRDVFCHFNGTTISPSQMVQQIARCRNIDQVYVFFHNRSSKSPKYETIDETDDYFKELGIMFNFDEIKTNYALEINDNKLLDQMFYKKENEKFIASPLTVKIFNKLYKQNCYNDDCYESNKYLHLMNILQSRGFDISDNDGKSTKASHREDKETIYENKIENFNYESEKVKNLNDYLNIPINQIDEYKDLFIDQNYLTKHLNVCKFWFQDNNENIIKLAKRLDFDITKYKDSSLKIKLLSEMMEKLGIDKNDIGDFMPENKKLDDTEKIKNTYIKLFGCRKKNLDLSIDRNMYKEICYIYNNMFNVTTSKRERFGNDRIYLYTVDKDILQWHKNVYQFRKKAKANELPKLLD
jgi:hypothetical protein